MCTFGGESRIRHTVVLRRIAFLPQAPLVAISDTAKEIFHKNSAPF
jgi:hypothetical protein